MAKIVFRDPNTPHLVCEHDVSRWLFSQETEFQRIDVFETPQYGRVLALGGVINTTEKDERGYHEMLVHVPLMAHPDPKDVLIIGGGDGGTLREVVRHTEVERAVMVEIDEVVVEACREHLPTIACAFEHPRAHLIIGDGLAHVRDSAEGSYDVILVDSTDPVDAAVELFTPEFYAHCHRALKKGGILVPQSDSFTYYPERVDKIQRTLADLFDVCTLYTSHVPTYPSGLWSFTFASKGVEPWGDEERVDTRYEAIEDGLCYYTPELHRAAFALPKMWRDRLAAESK